MFIAIYNNWDGIGPLLWSPNQEWVWQAVLLYKWKVGARIYLSFLISRAQVQKLDLFSGSYFLNCFFNLFFISEQFF
jgi:hypothetical protein